MSLCRLARGPLPLHCRSSRSSNRSCSATASTSSLAARHRQQQQQPSSRRCYSSFALPSSRSTSSDLLFSSISSTAFTPFSTSFILLLRRSSSKAGPPSSSSTPPSSDSANMAATSSALKSGSELRNRATAESSSKSSSGAAAAAADKTHSHTKKSGHDHAHHDHGIFGHTHSHGGDTEEAAALAAAFSGASDRGSRIILLGLASNILLTAAKGVGGYMLHSASLLADAGHSLSDLLGDIVVLFSWRLSRRPASRGFQYGYGKFEALGSLAVATALIGGALGIGVHSYFLFLHALSHAAMTAAPELAHAADTVLNSTSGVLSSIGGHAHVHAIDPNAAWIALLSVLIKEWMYRATLKVAKEERSNVLEANALHHRSDVFSGCLAGVAILGSSMGFPMLDPVGGLLVAGMIIKQGSEIGLNAMKELVDYAIDPKLTGQIEHFVLSMREDSAAVSTTTTTHDHAHDHTHEAGEGHSHDEHATSDLKLPIRSVSAVRTFKSGTFTLADMAIGFPPDLTVAQASKVADQIADSVKSQFPGIKEVVVRFDAEENMPHNH